MSGGAFDYAFLKINDLIMRLEEELRVNDSPDEDEYGDPVGRGYDLETVKKLELCKEILNRASEIARDIEWLYSGDHGEEIFRVLVDEELALLRKSI